MGKNSARGPKKARRKPSPTQSLPTFPGVDSAISTSCAAAATAANAFFSLASFDSDSGNTNATRRKLSRENEIATQKTEVTLSGDVDPLRRPPIGLNGCFRICAPMSGPRDRPT